MFCVKYISTTRAIPTSELEKNTIPGVWYPAEIFIRQSYKCNTVGCSLMHDTKTGNVKMMRFRKDVTKGANPQTSAPNEVMWTARGISFVTLVGQIDLDKLMALPFDGSVWCTRIDYTYLTFVHAKLMSRFLYEIIFVHKHDYTTRPTKNNDSAIFKSFPESQSSVVSVYCVSCLIRKSHKIVCALCADRAFKIYRKHYVCWIVLYRACLPTELIRCIIGFNAIYLRGGKIIGERVQK
jgi:hypothetical protein